MSTITLFSKCTPWTLVGLEKTTGMVPIDTVAQLHLMNGAILVQRVITQPVSIDVLSMAFVRVAARRCNWPVACFSSINWHARLSGDVIECVGEAKMYLTGTVTIRKIHQIPAEIRCQADARDDACDICFDPCVPADETNKFYHCDECGAAEVCPRCVVHVRDLGNICYMCFRDNLRRYVDARIFNKTLDRANGINDLHLRRLDIINPAIAKWRRKQISLLHEAFQEWKFSSPSYKLPATHNPEPANVWEGK